MIPFYTGTLRGGAIGKFLPGDHALADMNTPVVYNTTLDDLVTAYFQDLCHTPAQKIIPQVAQVQRFVGVGRGVFHHHFLPVGRFRTKPGLVII